MIDKITEGIDKAFQDATGNSIDMYYALYTEYIKGGEDPSAVLQYILQSSKEMLDTDDEYPPNVMSEEDEKTIGGIYIGLIIEMTAMLARKDLPIGDFYTELYHQVFEGVLLPHGDKYAAVYLKILAEKTASIPYFPAMDILEIEEEEWHKSIKRIEAQLMEAIHMARRSFARRTERTSQFFRIAAEIEDEKDRIVFWSLVITYMQTSE